MKKAHTVRKNGAQRMGIRILTLLFYGAVAGCTVWSRQGLLFLSFVPWLLMMTALLLYFESWQIHMTRDTIRKSVCGIDVGPYSFQQIVDVSQFRLPDGSSICGPDFLGWEENEVPSGRRRCGSSPQGDRVTPLHCVRVTDREINIKRVFHFLIFCI